MKVIQSYGECFQVHVYKLHIVIWMWYGSVGECIYFMFHGRMLSFFRVQPDCLVTAQGNQEFLTLTVCYLHATCCRRNTVNRLLFARVLFSRGWPALKGHRQDWWSLFTISFFPKLLYISSKKSSKNRTTISKLIVHGIGLHAAFEEREK